MGAGHPRSLIVIRRWVAEILLKAPLISRKRADITNLYHAWVSTS
jgi:hypothetical protein